MAENNEGQDNKPFSLVQLNKGLNTDSEELYQPEGSYRHALNCVVELRNGAVGDLSSELGNLACGNLPSDFQLVGTHIIDDNYILLFGHTLGVNRQSYIIKYNPNRCELTNLVVSKCLNFSNTFKPMDIKHRYLRGCELIVSFTDGVNPYRILNMNHLDWYLNDGETIDTANTTGEGWSCSKFNFFKGWQIPTWTDIKVKDGGGLLKVGIYNFNIRYIDKDGSHTDWIRFTKEVLVIDERIDDNSFSIDGAVNLVEGAAVGVPPVSKHIQISIDDIDTSYEYFQLSVVSYTSSLGTVTAVNILYPIYIDNKSNHVYLFTGESKDIQEVSTIDTFIPNVRLETVQHQELVDNRLILANVSEKTYDWSKFQRKASKIVTNWVSKELDRAYVDIDLGVPKVYGTTDLEQEFTGNPKVITDMKKESYYIDNRSFMSDEVYALAIVYYFKDGSKTHPFHIPGTAANVRTYFTSPTVYTDLDSPSLVSVGNSPASPNQTHYRSNLLPADNWDTFLLTVVEVTPPLSAPTNYFEVAIANVRHLGFKSITDDIGYGVGLVPRWLVYNTAITMNPTVIDEANLNRDGLMSYHQNINHKYPLLESCDNEDYWGTDYWGNPLFNTPIRHHKFPDTTLLPIHYEDKTRTLGLRVFNVEYPAEYIDDIIGFEIVCAERTEEEKTVIQKGVAYTPRITKDLLTSNGYLTSVTDTFALFNPLFGDRETDDDPPSGLWSTVTNIVNDNMSYNTIELDALENSTDILDFKKLIAYTSNELQFYNWNLKGTYVKIERFIRNFTYVNTDNDSSLDRWWVEIGKAIKQELRDNRIPALGNGADLIYHNRLIRNGYIVENNQTLTQSFLNGSVQGTMQGQWHKVVLGELFDSYTLYNKMTTNNGLEPFQGWTYENDVLSYYVSIKVQKDVYTNLENLRYLQLSNNIKRKDNSLPKDNIDNLFGADVFISDTWIKKLMVMGKVSKKLFYGLGFNGDDGGDYHIRTLMNICTESSINSDLRHSNYNDYTSYYYPKNFLVGLRGHYPLLFLDPAKGGLDFYGDFVDNGDCNNRKTIYSIEKFLYNKDFSVINKVLYHYPHSFKQSYCSNCLSKFTNRLWATDKSFNEENEDAFRYIRGLSYKDYYLEEGEITNIFSYDDKFFLHFENSLVAIQFNNSQIETSTGIAEIRQTNFLEAATKKITDLKYSYSGSQDKFATSVSEFGVLFVNQKNGKIFVIGQDGVNELNYQGLRNELEENIPIQFLLSFEQITDGKIKYPLYSNTINDYGVGFISVFDTRFKRTIIHKRDFIPLVSFTILSDLSQVGDFVYNFSSFSFGVVTTAGINPTIQRVSFNDTNYFENKSWTISYNHLTKAFISYHSYMPSWMFNNSETFFSKLNQSFGDEPVSNIIWKHNEGVHLRYYGEKYPCIVDFINNANGYLMKYFYNINLRVIFEKYHSTRKEWIVTKDLGFTHIIAYNTSQISLKHNLIQKQNYGAIQIHKPKIDFTDILATCSDNYWRINGFRDFCIQRPTESLFTKEWDFLKTARSILGQGYIDKVLNEAMIDVNKNIYKLETFKDKWFGVRLYYDRPDNDHRIKIGLVNNNIVLTQKTNVMNNG